MRSLFDGVALSLAESIVSRLENAGLDAVVAGGFLRDAALGAPAKDIDVFIPNLGERSTDQLERTLSGALGMKVAVQCDLSYGEDAEIARVFTEVSDSRLLVQVIEMAPGIDPLERSSRFDFALCQATYGSRSGLKVSQAFLRDLAHRTCTLVHCESAQEHARSMRRWARWQATHPVLSQMTLVDNTGPWL